MTAAIAPILPGNRRAALLVSPPSGPRRPLPLATVPTPWTPRTCKVDYGMSAMDSGGRIINDRITAEVLRWAPGTALTASATEDQVLVIRPDPSGGLHVTPIGHLRLPAAIRHRCRLRAGDRLLLAADPDEGELRLYPPAALDNLIDHHSLGSS